MHFTIWNGYDSLNIEIEILFEKKKLESYLDTFRATFIFFSPIEAEVELDFADSDSN